MRPMANVIRIVVVLVTGAAVGQDPSVEHPEKRASILIEAARVGVKNGH